MKLLNLFGGKLGNAGLAVALVIGLAGAASATIIDDFSTGQATMTIETGSMTSTVSGAGILGDYRDITISILAAPDSPLLPDASVGVAGGSLNISNGFDLTSTTLVAWDGDGVGAAAAGLGAAGNLSDTMAIVINVIFADLGADISFELMDTSGNTSTAMKSIGTGAGMYIFGLGSFVGDTVDLGALKSVKMSITGPAAFDMQVDIVETAVPEPSTMLLSGAALLALGLLRKRSVKA